MPYLFNPGHELKAFSKKFLVCYACQLISTSIPFDAKHVEGVVYVLDSFVNWCV